ncbi:MAG: zinc-ribbon domain-containing protein [Desulfobulbus sp.]|nr:zinc-ribbon domain-containing protein [Desulfobulbus sp.]
MLTHCPSCKKPLQLTDEQIARLEQALAQLAPGKLLTIKCPMCRNAISLDKTEKTPPDQSNPVQQPPPPKLEWLTMGLFQNMDKVEDVPKALLLHQDNGQRKGIGESLESVGYQVVMVNSMADAIESLRFINFSCIVFQANLEGPLEQSSFHAYMRRMPMEQRRYIFYILIGDQFHTLYDLEALAHSTNLTVNSGDLQHLDVVLRKSIPAYEELFGPMLEERGTYGKH